MEEKKSSVMETTTLTKVPANERKPWYTIAFIWAGSCICIPALMLGSLVSQGLNFTDSVIAMIIGYIIVVLYMTFLGMQSSDLGLPTTVAISRAYGTRGSSILISAIIIITMTGWFGYQTALCATSFCGIMSGYLNVDFPLWLSCLIWGAAMFITAVYGIKLIDILNKVSVPALIIMLVWGLIAALMRGAADTVSAYEPPAALGMVYGITLSVSGFASGAVICGDYTRYCKNRKDTIASSIVGVIPGGVGVLIIGAVLAISAGSYDLSVVFSNFGLPIIGLLVLILATWTTNTGNAYSAGIAVVNMFQMKDRMRASMTLICGAVGTILAMVGVVNYFVNFLSLIGYLVPPVAGVAIADYWIMGRGKPDWWEPKQGFNWLGIVSWLIGALTAYFTKFFVPTVNGIIAALLAYCILTALIKNETINPIAAMRNKFANK